MESTQTRDIVLGVFFPGPMPTHGVRAINKLHLKMEVIFQCVYSSLVLLAVEILIRI